MPPKKRKAALHEGHPFLTTKGRPVVDKHIGRNNETNLTNKLTPTTPNSFQKQPAVNNLSLAASQFLLFLEDQIEKDKKKEHGQFKDPGDGTLHLGELQRSEDFRRGGGAVSCRDGPKIRW